MFKRFSAALAAIMILVSASISTPAFARDEGRWAETVRNPADPTAAFAAGNKVCFGDRMQYTCVFKIPALGHAMIEFTSRQTRGIGTNQHGMFLAAITPEGDFMRDAQGRLIYSAANVSAGQNGAAIWNQALSQIPAAVLNGTGAAVVNNLLSPCKGGGCGSSMVQVNQGGQALANSESNAGSAVNVDIDAGVACASGGACGTNPHRP